MKYSLVCFLLVMICAPYCSPRPLSATNSSNASSTDSLAEAFAMPQDSLKPWVYYYWISDNVSREGITKDLEAMARVGIGTALIGNIGLPDVAPGKVPILSEDWWQMTEHAIREGKRVGVDIGLFNCPGWSQSGGPWVAPNEAMRYLVYSETTVKGGQRIEQKLPAPKDTFQDVKVIAFPLPKNDKASIADMNPTIRVSADTSFVSALVDGNLQTSCFLPQQDTVTIDIAVSNVFTARSLVLHAAEKPFSARVTLLAEQNGTMQPVTSFLFDRTNPNVNVGPVPFSPVAIALPDVASTKFRLVLTNIKERNGKKTAAAFADISLRCAPVLERYAEKKLDKMFQTPLPLWGEFQWATQPEAGTSAMNVEPAQVLDISKNLSADGTLNWMAPAGTWVVMRIGLTPTGTMNGPSAPNAQGLEVDKMNKQYLENHFNAYFGKVLERMPAADRTALKYVVMDSYEMGPQNWTEGLSTDFEKHYRYNPVPWLPVLSGRLVGSADQSNRFLWDLRRLVADKVAYEYVGGLRDISADHGLQTWLENYGHWGFPSEFLMYGGQSHQIAGEFWNEGELGNIECRAASSAAHIYGHQKVYAESYTAAGKPYERHPALLKKRGDWSFTEGINAVLLHLYIHQPYEDKTPGVNAWFGTEFNRKNTWFEQSKAWLDYQRRCMYLLQRGQVVNDVAYFIGEDAPKMTGVRDPEIPKGYSYDYINAEVLLTRTTVKGGELVLPDGMRYRVLVLPQLETMRPELLKKIKQLVEDGATILGPAPRRSPSLENFPAADATVQKTATELWGTADGKGRKKQGYGKGRVFNGMNLKEVMAELSLVPDMAFPEDENVLYTHRREGATDIYFLTNQTDKSITINPTFRVAGKQPELFDATTGRTRLLPRFMATESTTTVPLQLPPTGSYFVVFRKAAAPSANGAQNFPAADTIATPTGSWKVNFMAGRGPAGQALFPQLTDWSQHTDPAIKYYAGTAVYTQTVQVPQKGAGQRYVLSLGRVHNMARVRVNGKEAGAAWCPPYEVDVTDALTVGANKLQIEVVNSWTNRLIGDSKLPEADRKTWLSVNTIKPTQPLLPSGLMGPVRLLSYRYAE